MKLTCTALAALALLAAGCGGSGDAATKEVVLVTHDSFAISKPVKAAFERESGLTLKILQSGDAGEMVNRALLTKGNPQGDVLFGIDNNLLSRALEEGLFEPYEAAGLDSVPAQYALDPEHRVTPVDHGDVCLNTDSGWFAKRGIPAPHTLDELTDALYRGLLVVENPATSTPASRSCSPRSHDTARATGRTTGGSSAQIACSSSTAGRRRTRCSSPARPGARESGRSWSRTRRARPQR